MLDIGLDCMIINKSRHNVILPEYKNGRRIVRDPVWEMAGINILNNRSPFLEVVIPLHQVQSDYS